MSRTFSVVAAWVGAVAMMTLTACSVRFGSTDGYQFDFQGETAVRQQDGPISPDIKTVEVNNHFGGVRVEATDESPTWAWELTCWSTDADKALLFADEVELTVIQQTDTQSWIVVLPTPPAAELRGVRSDLTLKVPASVQVVVSNRFGDTSINDVQGSAVVESRHGQVELVGVSGSVDVKNEHGAVHASGIGAAHLKNRHGAVAVNEASGDLMVNNQHGEVTVESALGQLEVDNQHGRVVVRGVVGSAEIRTTHASIDVADAQGDVLVRDRHGSITVRRVAGRLEMDNQHGSMDADVDSAEVVCRSEHGRITLCLRNPELRSVRAETSFAGLRLRIPEGTLPVIEADVEYGKVLSDFPVRMAGTGAGGTPELADGVPRITLRNRHGNIHIQ